LENIFVSWAKSYFLNSGKQAPEVIIIYREGLSDMQVDKQLPAEIQAVNNMVTKIADKIKKPDYNPEIVYMTVEKKINTRFFSTYDGKGVKKGDPKLENPGSGSIILEEMSIDNAFDFHLVPQVVNQGTCTPTHYRVAYTNSEVPIESIAEFTFEQCFNYFNWQGAVRVPACLQAADKLSKLVGEYIKEDVKGGDLQDKQHYL